jgi:hypothetical protein
VLFRRQELNALISLHAEPQHDGSGGQGGRWWWCVCVGGGGGDTHTSARSRSGVGATVGNTCTGAGLSRQSWLLPLLPGCCHSSIGSCPAGGKRQLPRPQQTVASCSGARRWPSLACDGRSPAACRAAVGALTSDEATVIKGALDLASKTAEAVMTPLSKVRSVALAALGAARLARTGGCPARWAAWRAPSAEVDTAAAQRGAAPTDNRCPPPPPPHPPTHTGVHAAQRRRYRRPAAVHGAVGWAQSRAGV